MCRICGKTYTNYTLCLGHVVCHPEARLGDPHEFLMRVSLRKYVRGTRLPAYPGGPGEAGQVDGEWEDPLFELIHDDGYLGVNGRYRCSYSSPKPP